MRAVLCVLLLACATQAVAPANSGLLSRVADSFVSRGYVRADPFELSPLQVQKSLQEQPLDADTVGAEFASDIARENQPSEFEALLEANSKVNPEQQLKDIQAAIATLSTHESLIEMGAGMLQGAPGSSKSGSSRSQSGSSGSRGGHHPAPGHAGTGRRASAQAIEDCMACKFIWKQVEMDVANARYVEDVQASFEHNCLDAQKSTVFFKACEDMYDDMYAITDDYMSNEYTVGTMCRRANMCKDRKKGKGKKHSGSQSSKSASKSASKSGSK